MFSPQVKSYSSTEILEMLGPAETQYAALVPCDAQVEAGSNAPETHVIEMGATGGTFIFDWETYVQKDRVVVSYEGVTLFDSGCVGDNGSETLNFSGASSHVTVEVVPNCTGSSGTLWNWTVNCPNK